MARYCSRRRNNGRCCRFRQGVCTTAIQFTTPGLEFETVEQRCQRRDILRLRCKLVDAQRQFDIAFDGQQLFCLRQPVQRLAQVFADCAADVRRVFNDIVERAVLGQPFHRGFRPDLGHAGHVVDGIADQRQVINDALRRHAEFLFDASDVQFFVGHGVDQRDLLRDQLRDVLVTGGDHHTHAGLLGLARQRTDDIIGFHA